METERMLYGAAVTGDVFTLQELVNQDKLILDRVSLTHFNETPLHIASMRGHSEFVKEILNHNSQLTKELDSRKFTPLHIASAKGYFEVVKELLRVDPDMCFARDIDGRNPLHLAAMKDRIEVLKLLIETRPQAAFGKTNRGDNILHLCVKYGHLEALKIVLEMVGCNDEMVAAKDGDGNTILHLAALAKQIETIKHLVTLNNIAMDENRTLETTFELLSGRKTSYADLEINNIIREVGVLTADHLDSKQENRQNSPTQDGYNWLTQRRDAIMVVASLIATMAFQAGLNPAGGTWQDTKHSPDQNYPKPHLAGESIMTSHHPNEYQNYIRANTVAFVSSMSTILLLISGLPLRRKLFLWFLMATMWLTITSSTLTYGISIIVITPANSKNQNMRREIYKIIVWALVMALVLLGNTTRLILMLLKRQGAIMEMWPPTKWRKQTGSQTSLR